MTAFPLALCLVSSSVILNPVRTRNSLLYPIKFSFKVTSMSALIASAPFTVVSDSISLIPNMSRSSSSVRFRDPRKLSFIAGEVS
uniref:Putative secreted protein n=1 Tax=Ixodes ricinus TaxID=34613 RepID=A0A6B0TXY5_IXORI